MGKAPIQQSAMFGKGPSLGEGHDIKGPFTLRVVLYQTDCQYAGCRTTVSTLGVGLLAYTGCRITGSTLGVGLLSVHWV